MSAMQVSADPDFPAFVPRARFEQNTFVSVIGRRPTVRMSQRTTLDFNRNLVWASGTMEHVGLTDPAAVNSMNDNWYVPNDAGTCLIGRSPLASWRGNGFDTRSECATVPGVTEPTAAEAANPQGYRALIASRFTPRADWAGCARNIGAVDCQGRLRVGFEPIAGYADNGGYGWNGGVVVRQRYTLR
jgi:hypothetical protein